MGWLVHTLGAAGAGVLPGSVEAKECGAGPDMLHQTGVDGVLPVHTVPLHVVRDQQVLQVVVLRFELL